MIVLPLQPVYAWLLVFLRVGLILSLMPLFGENFAPLRVRILFAAAISLALTPAVPVSGAMFPGTVEGVVALILREALLGFGVALCGSIMFAVVQASGQIAGEQMGFGMVNSIDPTEAREISVVSELQYVLGAALFFCSGMHRPFLRLIAWSFSALPPGQAAINASVVALIMKLGGVMFALTLGFAMPIIAIVFVINVALGMIGRAVPQVNVFMESFPLRIIAGLSVMMVILGELSQGWVSMFGDMEKAMAQVIRLMQGS
jgi:flagellar biosynthetic protein FliR